MSDPGEQLPPTHQPYGGRREPDAGQGFTSPSGPAAPEPTQPYAQPHPQPGPAYGPPSGSQPTYAQPVYEQPTGPPSPYGQPVTSPYGQTPYGQPGQPYGQPGYGQPYGQAPSPYGYPTPGYPAYAGAYTVDHPSANTAMILGIVGLVGTFLCGIGVVLGPFAWAMGAKARREIDREPQRYGGRSQAVTGMVLGIVTSVFLVLVVLLVVLAVAGAFAGGSSSDY